MIAARFEEQVRIDGSRLALRTGQRDWSYAQLLEHATRFEEQLSNLSGQQIGIVGQDLSARILGLLAAELNGITACLFPTGMNSSSMTEWAERLGLVDLFDPSEPLSESSTFFVSWRKQLRGEDSLPALWLFTSGTTGPPQPVRHTWQALTSTVHTGPSFQNRRWLLAYDPASFAGVQVMLQALLTGGTLSDVSQATLEETARRIVAEQVEFASGTPTFWRMLLGAIDPAVWKQAAIEQITLGGEAVSEGTLTALKAAFPQARISHIYATSELGVCFSVSDGHAGFPASYLENPPGGCQLRISDEGELEVLSPRCGRTLEDDDDSASNHAASAWQATGDLVELRVDRVYFVGRKSGAIVVGGGKVVPEEVESVIRDVPGVVEVRISGQPSSVLGAIVQADVVASPGTEPNTVRAAILAACQAQLPRHKVPAMIEFHNTLPRTPSGKLARSAEAAENVRPNP
jgi:acyl-CoA synthetase (AMP-forming)/AMP-acid ligase II